MGIFETSDPGLRLPWRSSASPGTGHTPSRCAVASSPSRRAPLWPSSPSPCSWPFCVPAGRAFDAPLALDACGHLRASRPGALPDRLRLHDPHAGRARADALPPPARVRAAARGGRDGARQRCRSTYAGERHPNRVARRRWRNAWHSVGPVAVLAARRDHGAGAERVAGAAGRARGAGGDRQRRRDSPRLGRAWASRRSSSRRCSVGSRSWTCCCRRSACWRRWPPSKSPTPCCWCCRSPPCSWSSPSSAARACARRSS